jgi:transcriptional regulator with XRE-family HTH domain
MKEKTGITSEYIQQYRERIGNELRAMREKKGLSQDDLAEIMDIHRATISKIETGKFAITIDYLVKFGWHLDFEIALTKI